MKTFDDWWASDGKFFDPEREAPVLTGPKRLAPVVVIKDGLPPIVA